jgi:hypothetical protein
MRDLYSLTILISLAKAAQLQPTQPLFPRQDSITATPITVGYLSIGELDGSTACECHASQLRSDAKSTSMGRGYLDVLHGNRILDHIRKPLANMSILARIRLRP